MWSARSRCSDASRACTRLFAVIAACVEVAVADVERVFGADDEVISVAG